MTLRYSYSGERPLLVLNVVYERSPIQTHTRSHRLATQKVSSPPDSIRRLANMTVRVQHLGYFSLQRRGAGGGGAICHCSLAPRQNEKRSPHVPARDSRPENCLGAHLVHIANNVGGLWTSISTEEAQSTPLLLVESRGLVNPRGRAKAVSSWYCHTPRWAM